MPERYFTEDSVPGLQLPAADSQAEALNRQLCNTAPAVYNMLSPCGKSLYYPRQGLLLQAEEAAESRYNGTVGVALDDEGKHMHYNGISSMLNIDVHRCIPYASSYGLPPLRQLWLEQLQEKNPILRQKLEQNEISLSLPVVTGGITHGLWMAFQMLLGRGEELLLPDLFWPNYRLIAQSNCGACLKTYNTFSKGRLDLEAIRNELLAPGNKKVLLFNFPHNPTGYSPQKEEVGYLQEILSEAAQAGKHIAVICDDAYWGLCYEEGTERQSLFSFVVGLHPNILAVKLDGATKEDFAWGLRIGFITFGLLKTQSPTDLPPQQGSENKGSENEGPGNEGLANEGPEKVLEQKAGAMVRLSTSNSSRLSQEILLNTYNAPETKAERKKLQDVLATRYRTVRQYLDSAEARQEWSRYLKPLPFNSGYFMTFEMQQHGFSADVFRKHLLAKHDIGLIALQDKYLRFAFSAVAAKDIPHVLGTLHQTYVDFHNSQQQAETKSS
ncbi:aminotransferase class I/II-fold pyridoxal phosphate-dependent enzyme [Candidatus Haliotispira prima]|uniref:Aminotransferase class I/II-fold pyridoxal phosphate-dependent enzyme n=1 Tax=Candidatus Haliotispira prima TaxID=3034016 RepID=A0ABY8MM07_9SPIO|nr:aminotransferase class I/II-fold pyridoxal phosphate-dependent enzyme [Candidatus Haliotispira prima]